MTVQGEAPPRRLLPGVGGVAWLVAVLSVEELTDEPPATQCGAPGTGRLAGPRGRALACRVHNSSRQRDRDGRDE